MAQNKSNQVYRGACHCGKVTWTFKAEPEWLTECNCSICSRLAALWGQTEIDSILIEGEEETLVYVWGSKMVAFHTCKHCGCTTHWNSLMPDEFSRMSVNFRLCPAIEREGITVRTFDGANSWEFLD